MTHAAPERLPLRVHALRRIAETIIELDLRGEAGRQRPSRPARTWICIFRAA